MIRKLIFDDIEQVNNLGKELYTNFTDLFNLKNIISDKYTHVLVLENDNKIIGFLMFTKVYETIDIIAIVVAKEYRNHKYASTMIDYMISEYNNDLKIITLEVNVDNTPAIKLYEKFGFEIVNTRKKYFNDKDSYLMAVVYK